jgi:hypothetical protein
MFIKPSNKRIEFERMLISLGYKDRSPILKKESKWKKQVNYMCPTGAMAIYSYFIPYFNKKSYLYVEFLDNYESKDIRQKIKSLAKRIKFQEKTRIGEVGWEVAYTKNPNEFTPEERKKILYEFIRELYKNLKSGFFNITPNPGDILAANPYGPKIGQGFNESSIQIGTRQRELLARKFGFGKSYDDGFCYARYDNDLNLIAI